MVSWWGRYSCFINESIQIGDIELMNNAYGSSGSFGSRVSFKYIGHNIYIGRRINSHSKPTPIHGPVHKSDLNFSYSRSHFSRLKQSVYKELINHLSLKVSYDYIIIDSVINGFIPN